MSWRAWHAWQEWRSRRPWRSPAGQPPYARPLLLLISAIAVVLYTWGINRSQFHPFYADAALSMTRNWKAFFFGSFEPGNSITLDKLPGFLWPQALAARLFGFHPWAVTAPQVIEGVLSVLVLYRVVRRGAGANAGLLAAAAFTVTPVLAGLFRSSVEDAPFTLLLLLAADAVTAAARTGRPRPLMACGVWVGLAFQTKMLEAWAVLPAFAAVFLLTAPLGRGRRAARLALAGAVTVAVSASWVLLVAVIPAADRPYIDGTVDNSPVSMVVGYNFLNRFPSLGLSAADTGSVTATTGGGPAGTNSAGERAPGGGSGHRAVPSPERGAKATTGTGTATADDGGWTKMFRTHLASQTGWFYPLAGLALACGLWWRRDAPRGDPQRAALILWGTWLLTFLLVFSAGSVGVHTYYMGVVAAPLAALTGIGMVLLWRAWRAGGRRAWALPVAVAASAGWGAALVSAHPRFLPWLAPAIAVLAVPAVGALLPVRSHTARGRAALAGFLAGVLTVFLAPAAWTASVLAPRYGQSGTGTVGPAGVAEPWRPQVLVAGGHEAPAGSASSGSGSPSPGSTGSGRRGPSPQGADARRLALIRYLRAHRDGAAYLVAATSWNTASPFILATGEPVLSVGGFTGKAPSPTPGQLRDYVETGRLRFVLVRRPRTASHAASPATTPSARIASWVRSACRPVPAVAYGSELSDPTDGTPLQLYRCGDSQP